MFLHENNQSYFQLWSFSSLPHLFSHYEVLPVCKTCYSLKVCANRCHYTHSSPPRPFHSQSTMFSSSYPSSFCSPSLCPFSASLISSVLNSGGSDQECPDKLIKITSDCNRRQQTGLTLQLIVQKVEQKDALETP